MARRFKSVEIALIRGIVREELAKQADDKEEKKKGAKSKADDKASKK